MSRLLKHACSSLALAVAICCGAAVQAQATPLVISITNPTQSVTQGGTVVFSGTFANPNAIPFSVNTIIFSEVTPGGIDQLFSGFFPPGFPPNPVPGLTTVSGDILGLTFRTTAVPGDYIFTIAVRGSVLGGEEENSDAFPVTVTILSPVPEPTAMILLGTGLAGAVGAIRKRRKCSSEPRIRLEAGF